MRLFLGVVVVGLAFLAISGMATMGPVGWLGIGITTWVLIFGDWGT